MTRFQLTAAIFALSAMACSAKPPTPAADSPARAASLIERSRLTMGSTLRLQVWTTDPAGAEAALNDVFAEFDRLDQMMSVWREGSDILRLNRAAGDHPVPVAPEMIAVLTEARQISEWTGGEFDVTFGALAGLWKFDHDQDNVVPDMNEVRRRLPLIDYRALEIDANAGTAFLKRKGMSAHLGGIGKGYAIDRAIAIFHRHGLRDFLIQSGGDMYVGGLKDNKPWRLGIQDPRGPKDHPFAELDLSDGTFSTSGDYERFFLKNGRRYHHIIDPATGEPAKGCRSVTIVADKAWLADGLSTGVFLLGPDAGMALIERLPDVEGVIVSSKNEVLISSGLKDKLRIVASPTAAP